MDSRPSPRAKEPNYSGTVVNTNESKLALATSDIGSARVNWHPHVHQRFDEDLYFILFHLAQPQNVADQLVSIFESANIFAHSLYVIFGYFDGLARVWLTPQQLRGVYRAIKQHENDILETRVLKVVGLRYFWANHGLESLLDATGPPPEVLKNITAEYSAIARVAGHPVEPSAEDVGSLLAQRLLLLKPAEIDANIKVFVLLQATGQQEANASFELARRMTERSQFAMSSLYSGEGSLASHLIRLTVVDYDHVLETTTAIHELISDLGFRPMTLLVANTGPAETDNLNNLYALTGSQHRTADLLGIDANDLTSLNQESRNVLDVLVDELTRSLANVPERETAQEVLKACIQNDRRLARQHLSFVLDFEQYFRDYVSELLQRELGSEWLQTIARLPENPLRNVSGEYRESIEQWPLGVVHNVLRDLTNEDPELRRQVLSDLGEDWSRHIRSVMNLRNPFAHGKLLQAVPQLNDLTGEWGASVTSLLRALPLYHALYKTTEKEDY
jgi:hypothetical protein